MLFEGQLSINSIPEFHYGAQDPHLGFLHNLEHSNSYLLEYTFKKQKRETTKEELKGKIFFSKFFLKSTHFQSPTFLQN